jgi:hypothetical protein
MRTPEQIENLRRVLKNMGNPLGFIGDNFMIDLWADSIQNQVDSIKLKWRTKIRFESNKETAWKNIRLEPKITIASLKQIRKLSMDMLDKYPDLNAIQIIEESEGNDVYVFERGKNEPSTDS